MLISVRERIIRRRGPATGYRRGPAWMAFSEYKPNPRRSSGPRHERQIPAAPVPHGLPDGRVQTVVLGVGLLGSPLVGRSHEQAV